MYFPTMPIYKTAWLKKEKKRNKKNPIKKKRKKNHTEKMITTQNIWVVFSALLALELKKYIKYSDKAFIHRFLYILNKV